MTQRANSWSSTMQSNVITDSVTISVPGWSTERSHQVFNTRLSSSVRWKTALFLGWIDPLEWLTDTNKPFCLHMEIQLRRCLDWLAGQTFIFFPATALRLKALAARLQWAPDCLPSTRNAACDGQTCSVVSIHIQSALEEKTDGEECDTWT